MRRPLGRRLALVLGGIVLALPAPASADDLFVAKTGADSASCGTAGDPCLTVGRAAANARLHDTIHIGPGHYSEAVLSSKGLTFVGAGTGTLTAFDASKQTFIDASGTDFSALRLTRGGAVRSLRTKGRGTGGFGGGCKPGIELENATAPFDVGTPAFTYEVSNVLALPSEQDDANGLLFCPGIRAFDGGTGRTIGLDARDTFTPDDDVTGVELNGPHVSATLVRHRTNTQSLDAPGGHQSVVLRDGAGATAVDSTLTGVDMDSSTTFSALRSRIFNQGPPLRFDAQGAAGSASITLRDTALWERGASPALLVRTGENEVDVDVRQSSLVATGGAKAALDVQAEVPAQGLGGDVGVQLVNTLVRNDHPAAGGVDVLADASSTRLATVTASTSAYSSAAARNGASVTPPGTGGGVTGDAQLADAQTGDLHLLPQSPLVDAGDAGQLDPGELDADRHTRALDGDGDCTRIPDIGAFEAPRFPGTSCAGRGDHTPPRISKLHASPKSFRPGAGTTFKFKLSEMARIEIEIARERSGRRVGGRCRKPTAANRGKPHCVRVIPVGGLVRQGRKGKNSLHFSGRLHGDDLPLGAYRARFTAVDRAGNRSKHKRVRFHVVQPPS